MRWWIACCSLLLASAASCRHEDEPAKPDELRAYLPAAEGKRLFPPSAPPPRGYFVPTAAEIAALEARLMAELRNRRSWPPNETPLALRAPGYFRQYVSYVDASGHRWIWGNFFCRSPRHDDPDIWRTRLIRVSDGGDCYFTVEHGPDSGQLRNLFINGDA